MQNNSGKTTVQDCLIAKKQPVIHKKRWKQQEWFKQFIQKLSTEVCEHQTITRPDFSPQKDLPNVFHQTNRGMVTDQICSHSLCSDSDQTHAVASSSPGHPETHTHTHIDQTHTHQNPSVTPDCCRVSTKNNPTQLLLWRSPPLCGRNTCQDLHSGEIAESQGLITLSWLLLHIYYLLYASNFTALVSRF